MGNFFKNISESQNYKTIRLQMIFGVGVFFFEKILPIIVLKHNLQLFPVNFAPICV